MDTTEYINSVNVNRDVVSGLNIILLNRPNIENTSRSIPGLPAVNPLITIETSKAL
jgi:hypothetical protein